MLWYSNHAPTGTLRFNLHRANYDGMRESLDAIDWYSELSSMMHGTIFYNVFNDVIKCNTRMIKN